MRRPCEAQTAEQTEVEVKLGKTKLNETWDEKRGVGESKKKHLVYENPTANIILGGERLKVFPLRTGTKQGCLLLPLLFITELEGLARAINQEKRNGNTQNVKENVKTFIHR